MEEYYFEIGYDITGRRILLDENNNFITYIPDDLSEEEALDKIQNGEFLLIQSKTKPKEVEIAPKEDWPLLYSWNVKQKDHTKDKIEFEKFAEIFKSTNLSPEQEWEIICFWKNYISAYPKRKISLEEFRKNCIENIYKKDDSSPKR